MDIPLSRRTALRYARLAVQVLALRAAHRDHGGAAATPTTIAQINRIHAQANRVFAREADLPRFPLLPETASVGPFDIRQFLAQLVDACDSFERRHIDIRPRLSPPRG